MVSKYQKYLDCEHEWVSEFTKATQCQNCKMLYRERHLIQDIAELEAQLDEAVNVCEAVMMFLELDATIEYADKIWEELKAVITKVKREN